MTTRADATHVLVVGVSTRAVAESAVRAGYRVTALDAFGDLDQHADVRALSLPRDFGRPYAVAAAIDAGATIAADAVVYLSDLDNAPAAVGALADGRQLWGNTPATLARVRQPAVLVDALRARGCAVPAIASPDVRDDDGAHVGRRWMLKPLASGGGRGVRPWRAGTAVPPASVLQARIDGTPGSVVFVADGHHAVVLGVSRQLIGDRAFGARGFRYCGSILAGTGDAQFSEDAALVSGAIRLAECATEAFGLTGVNGIDFIAREGVPYAIEVNPRWTASMELVERAYGVSVFAWHAAVYEGGRLSPFDVGPARAAARAHGKAVVFARRAVRAGDTREWLADASVRDVPVPGTMIPAGSPVCTVFAQAPTADACYAALVERAVQVYAALGAWTECAA